jgi:16S rRNA processing protein RimM
VSGRPSAGAGGPESSDWLVVGRVGRPHGLDGSFHVTRPRPALLPLGAAVRVGDRQAEIIRRAGTGDRPILRLAGFEGREAAEALRGQDLLVPRQAAPELGEDEWYAEDLVGLQVVDAGREVGTVGRLVALPSVEALEVERPAGEALLVPLVRDCVRAVDLAGRVVDIDLAFLGDTLPEDLVPGDDPPAA